MYYNRSQSKRNLGDRGGASADFDKVVELYDQRGSTRLNDGDLDRAIADFSKATELKPEDAYAYYTRAKAKVALAVARHTGGDEKAAPGGLQDALSDFDKAIELKSNYAEAYADRGSAKGRQGDFEGALADVSRAIQLKPDLGAAYGTRGILRMAKADRGSRNDEAHELEVALADFDKAIELDPNDAQVYMNRGSARLVMGLKEDFWPKVDQAITLGIEGFARYVSERIRKEEKEALAGAVRDYDRAIKLKPSEPNAYSNRGNARFAQGELREALADLEQAIILQTRPTAENFRDRGRVRAISGEFEKALADFNKAIELAPEFSEPYQWRAEVRKAQGDKAGARADIEQFERLNKAKGANGK